MIWLAVILGGLIWYTVNSRTTPADKFGNLYAPVGSLHAGMCAWVDDGFPCMNNYEHRRMRGVTINEDEHGLYFHCHGSNEEFGQPASEKHYLDGQEKEEPARWWRLGIRREYYMGIYLQHGELNNVE